MGIEYEGDKLEEIVRLTRENNRMLHAMRRNAFLSGLFRIVVWIALIVIPFWLYLQYLAPVLNSMMDTMAQIEGTRAGAEAQMSGFNDALQKLRDQFPQYFQGQ